LGEEFWGRGIMTEVVTAVTDFCFDNFPLRRISAEVFANNPASARVLEKAGFTFEGRLKDNVVKDGQVLHSLLYARTKSRRASRPTCLCVDHGRYDPPRQTNDFIYRSRV
jgi:ribosomal-protein-alanine N-acetyltransferase